MLKEEMVGRERLQLNFTARDIQKVFAEVIPHAKNWEISVRWRPAGRLAGIFTILNLPDGRLGFVMAMYQTKYTGCSLYDGYRTLIHATAKKS